MAVLDKLDYEQLAAYYCNLRLELDGAVGYLLDAATLIVELDDFDQTLDLLRPFYDTYTTQTAVIQSNQGLIAAVRALNNHVIRGSGDTLAEWIADQDFNDASAVLSETWYDLCTAAGFDNGVADMADPYNQFPHSTTPFVATT